MSTANKIFSNTAWQFLSKLLLSLLGLLVIKITTHYLATNGGVALYGQYTAIYEYLAYFGIIADLGLYTIAVREMSRDENNIPKIIGNVLSLRLILITVTMAIAASLIFFIPQYNFPGSHIPIGVAIASISVFLTILNGTITSVLQTKYQMGRASIGVVIGKIATIAYMAFVIFYLYPDNIAKGFDHLIIAGVFGAVINLLQTHYYVRKITPIKPRFDLDLWKRIIKESLPYGIALLLSTLYFRIDSVVILFTRGQEELGLYAPAMKLLEQMTILPLYFMNSILPILSKSVDNKDGKHREIINNSFTALAAMSVPMAIGGAILAYPIVFVMTTPDFLSRLSEGFYGTDIALKILIFAVLFQFLNVLFAFILIAVNQQKKLLYINAVCVCLNLGLNLIFVPTYGFPAAAVTSVLSELFILIATFLVARKYLTFKISLINPIKIIFSALVMGLAIYLLQPITYHYLENWNVLLLIGLGVIIYTVMIFATKTIDKQTLKTLLKKPS